MSLAASHLQVVAHEVLSTHDGVAHLQRFLEAGLSRNDVARALHLGIVQRPRIGWYCLPTLSSAAVRAVRVGGVLGCVSAAAELGIVTPERSGRLLHVSLSPDATRLRRADDSSRRVAAGQDRTVRWHWEHRSEPVRGYHAHPIDVLLQMASCVPGPWLVAAIDSALSAAQRSPLLATSELPRLRSLLPEHHRAAVDRSDARSEAPGESLLRVGLQDARIPVEPQVWLTQRYRADLLVDGWLPVEVDGAAIHGTSEGFEYDRERDATLAWFLSHPLRFSQRLVVDDLPFVVAAVRRVWLGGPPRR